jgi:tight adherence protein C
VSAPVIGIALGLLAAVGLILAVAASPPLRRVRLDDRLAPYLRDARRPSRLIVDRGALTPLSVCSAR